MRRFRSVFTMMVAAIGLVLAASACTSTESAPTTTSQPEPAATSTTTTPTTTSTSTTSTSTTTTTEPPPSGFEVIAGTPPAELDAFAGSSVIAVVIGDLEIETSADSVFMEDLAYCESVASVSGLSVISKLLATPDRVWLDSGEGFIESSYDDPDVLSTGQLCPANPSFWADFASPIPNNLEGELVEFAGMPAQQFDLTGFESAFGSFGLPEDVGAEIETLIAWIAEPGGWMVGFEMFMRVAPESLATVFDLPAETTGDDEGSMLYAFAVSEGDTLTEDVVPCNVDWTSDSSANVTDPNCSATNMQAANGDHFLILEGQIPEESMADFAADGTPALSEQTCAVNYLYWLRSGGETPFIFVESVRQFTPEGEMLEICLLSPMNPQVAS